jgi:AAHS family 4-hydroxybenzoate transporter-like MFS transporter
MGYNSERVHHEAAEDVEGRRVSQEATSAATALVNIGELIDEQRIGRFQIWVLLLCASAMFVDGFDTQAIGYVAPSLSAALALKTGFPYGYIIAL